MSDDAKRWMQRAAELAALAQTGLTYARDPFDVRRYERVREIAAEMMAAGTGTPEPAVLDSLRGDTGHATPKVDVRAAVFQGGRVLLVRERSDGRWTLPGGWADPGESAGHGVAREVEEESGYRVRATRLLAAYDLNAERHAHPPRPFFAYKLFFECVLLGGEPRASDETDEVGWFAPDALPPLSLSRVTPAQIARLFTLAADPAAPADFD